MKKTQYIVISDSPYGYETDYEIFDTYEEAYDYITAYHVTKGKLDDDFILIQGSNITQEVKPPKEDK